MRKKLIKGLICAFAFCLTPITYAGYVGDPIAMDAPYELNYDLNSDSTDGYYNNTENSSTGLSNMTLNPSEFGYEFYGPMKFHTGGGHAKIHQAYIYAHIFKQKSEEKFTMGLDLITRMTWFSAPNSTIFKSERLYSVGLNLSGSYAFNDDTRAFFGASATLSSDFDTVTSHCVQIGARGGISHRFNDRFSLQLGVYFSPQMASCPVLPIIGFRYLVNDSWYLQLDPLRFRAINTVNDTFSWGPFVGIQAGSWNIKRDRRDTRFSMLSGVCGLQANIALGNFGSVTPVLTTEIGCTFANNFQYRNSTGKHKLESVNADPGLFLKVGIKMSF